MPKVLNRRTKVLNLKDIGYKVPDGAVYVGRAMPRYGLRPTKWGNPMTVKEIQTLCPNLTKEEAHQEAVSWYRQYIYLKPELLYSLSELRGKDLVCWCHTWDGLGENPMYCHADILLELANGGK